MFVGQGGREGPRFVSTGDLEDQVVFAVDLVQDLQGGHMMKKKFKN